MLGAAFERVVDFHLSGAAGAHPETARAILTAWIGSIRAALLEKPASHMLLMERSSSGGFTPSASGGERQGW